MTLKTSVYIATSLDGFIARVDGGIDWLLAANDPSNTEDYGYQAFFDTIDTLVMGRNTFDLAVSFEHWPYGSKQVVVLSSRPITIPKVLSASVTNLHLEPQAVIDYLTTRGAKHLYIDGGKTIQRFLNAGLIDELIITRIPILIGSGIPLFGPTPSDIQLQHLATTAYPNGFVQSHYRIKQG